MTVRVFNHEDRLLHINSFAIYSDCAVPDNISIILPPEEELQPSGRWGFWRTKKFKEMYEEFPVWVVWKFSGTTHIKT